jgi:hypothetical protein
VRLAAADRAPFEVRADADPPRHCRRCGCKLNRYNPASLCHPCQCPREGTRRGILAQRRRGAERAGE